MVAKTYIFYNVLSIDIMFQNYQAKLSSGIVARNPQRPKVDCYHKLVDTFHNVNECKTVVYLIG